MPFNNAHWITPQDEINTPVFQKTFTLSEKVSKATLFVTSKGVYSGELNGGLVGNFILAPGWTMYKKRRQYQEYDVTHMLKTENTLTITVGCGWERGSLLFMRNKDITFAPAGLIASLKIQYEDGNTEEIITDESWDCFQGNVISSDIYNGEVYDATASSSAPEKAILFNEPKNTLIPQEGEYVTEHERLSPVSIFTAPNGEKIIDFGQNLTGYPEIHISAKKGDVVDLSFGEVLDKDGNFYNDNYRAAKCEYHYMCKDGEQTYKPGFTFYGFRYLRVNSFPCEITPENITAVAVYSDIKQTGFIETSHPLLNKLFSNILWGQKDNFLDIPTDCPQRDERLGWVGDAQVFARTACKNFDSEKFFKKWLNCLSAEQLENGLIPKVIPNCSELLYDPSAGWQDAAVIVPWEVYLAYGDKKVLENQFSSMRRWVDFVTNDTKDEFLWTGRTTHYGDWLGLDAPYGSYIGASRRDFIASAYHAYTTEILVKAGKIIGENVEKYEALYKSIKAKFKETFNTFTTQTECALALYFGLTDKPEDVAKQLNDMVISNGRKLTTGFIGTPYLMHALSNNGYTETAYDLLLQEDFPSWLYSVNQGATTTWEHWDSKNEKGEFWSTDMNSFNHYAYGVVAEWMYSVAGGIIIDEENPGYKKVVISPKPDKRLSYFKTTLKTRNGEIKSSWEYVGDNVTYKIETPVETTIIINGIEKVVNPGSYTF